MRSHRTVVVEKPFVTTSAEADRLIALAKEKGVILTVFQSIVSLFLLLIMAKPCHSAVVSGLQDNRAAVIDRC